MHWKNLAELERRFVCSVESIDDQKLVCRLRGHKYEVAYVARDFKTQCHFRDASHVLLRSPVGAPEPVRWNGERWQVWRPPPPMPDGE